MEPQFVCDGCKKSFANNSSLQRHQKSGVCGKSNKCPECDQSFALKKELQGHMKTEHSTEVKCPICDKSFANEANMERHQKSAACGKSHQCPECDQSFALKKELQAHMKTEHPPEVKCPICEKPFANEANLKRHRNSEACGGVSARRLCPQCSEPFTDEQKMNTHIIENHPDEASNLLPDLTCDKCLKVFEKDSHLRRHKKVDFCQKRVEEHPCPECGVMFKFKKHMLEHMRKFHPAAAPEKRPHTLKDIEEFKCKTCGEAFKTGRELSYHKNTVHVRLPKDTTTEKMMKYFTCKECDEGFPSKAALIQHRKVHRSDSSDEDGPSQYKCAYAGCEESYQRRSELLKHQLTHREQDENSCVICDESFQPEAELRTHMEDVHGENLKKYRCPYKKCSFQCDNEIELTDHKENVHEEEAVQCDQCNKWLKSLNQLRIHKMDEHDKEPEPVIGTDMLMDDISPKALYREVGETITDIAGKPKFRTTRTRQPFRLTQAAINLCMEGFALEVICKVIDGLTKKFVEKGGYIQIKLISETLDFSIVMPLVHVKFFDPLVLLNYIEKVLSSKDELALDKAMTFDVIHVEDFGGSGYRLNATNIDSWLKRRVGIFDPRNVDHRCLGLCLIAWQMIQNVQSREAMYKASFYKNPAACRILQQGTNKLYSDALVDMNKECGREELNKFQTIFNERHGKQIIVLDENCVHTYRGQPERENENDQLFLLWAGNHYYLVWDLDGLVGSSKKYCHRCGTIHDKEKNHHCIDLCDKCYRPNCEAGDTIILCEKCNITFSHAECYFAHTDKVCMKKRFRCPDCLSIRYEGIEHECGKKSKCPHCYQEVDLAIHLCEVQEPSEKARLGGSEQFNVVYFDAETAVNKEGHLDPYLICSAVNCEKCIDLETDLCEQCGNRYKSYYGWDCAKNFCDWLATNKRISKYRTILTAHNSAKFDAYFIYEYAAQTASPKFKVNFKANELLSFTWNKIQLKDSLQFMKCALDKLPSILGLQGVEKGFYAWRLADSDRTLTYRGPMPHPNDFGIEKMESAKQDEFWTWYGTLAADPNFVYAMEDEAIKYCNMDVKILEAAWKSFRKSCLKLTDGEVDPLLSRYFTLASFSAAIYKTLFMETPIGIVPYGGYRNPQRTGQSWEGSAYLDYLNDQREKNGQQPLICANNSQGEVAIGGYHVDGYCQETGDVYEILGCMWHSHTDSKTCRFRNQRRTQHPYRKPLTYEDVNRETMNRLLLIKNTGRNVHFIWICDIKKQMKTNPLLKAFMHDKDMKKLYSKPLDPKMAVFGGRVESFKPRMVLTDEQIEAGYTIEYVDFCSLYPYVQWHFPYTTQAHPDVIVKQTELRRYVEDEQDFMEFLETNYGLCYCNVLPPYKLNFAVLPYRTRHKTVFTLCKTCAEEDINEGCSHDGEARELEGVYTFYELLHAIKRGYNVTHIFEMWNYGDGKDKIMAKYVSKMIKLKTQHSPVPANMTAQEFCDLWNERVPGLGLKPDELAPSPAMRLSAKILMNSLWGKFCERASKTSTKLIDTWLTLKKSLDNKENAVSRVEQISSRSLAISIEKKDEFLTETAMYNPVLGAYVTAYARMTLLEKCLEVVGDRALYCDTDSLVYLRIPGTPDPIRGEALGQLANELKDDEFIGCFQCIAPKTWRAEVYVKTNETSWSPSRTIVKSKGVHLGALGSSIRDAMDQRKLWDALIESRLIDDDSMAPCKSIDEFYKALQGYKLPEELFKPCLEKFIQQKKWDEGRSSKNAPGLIVPQPHLTRDRFTAKLTDARLANKIVRFRHDKSMLLNKEEHWPENQSSTRPFGYR